MRPADCLPQDRRHYFHNGWGLVEGEVCRLSVGDSGTMRASTRDTGQRNAPLRHIEPFYPEGGCINTYDVGIVIARRARQCRRRTASVQHFDVVWTPPQRRLSMDTHIMWDLCDPQEPYPSYDDCIELLGGVASVALSRNLLLFGRPDDGINVLWHTHPVGRVQAGVFVPDYEDSCFTKLARMELQELDAPCL